MDPGGEAQVVDVVVGAGEVGSSGGVIERGGRAVVKDEREVAGRQSPERGWLQVPSGVDWRWGEKMEAEWLSSGRILTGGRAAEACSSSVLWCSLGADNRGGDGLEGENGGVLLKGDRGLSFIGDRGVGRHGGLR